MVISELLFNGLSTLIEAYDLPVDLDNLFDLDNPFDFDLPFDLNNLFDFDNPFDLDLPFDLDNLSLDRLYFFNNLLGKHRDLFLN